MRTERFNRAFDALTLAFFNGTLAKWDCACCVVGSIVAYSLPCGQLTEEEFSLLKLLYNPNPTIPRMDPISMELGGPLDKCGFIMDSWKTVYSANPLADDEYWNNPGPEGYTGKEKASIERAFDRYGINPHSFGGQRDGYNEGFKSALKYIHDKA